MAARGAEMKRIGHAALVCTALSTIGLTGCEEVTSFRLDPLSTQGRNGNAPTVTYDAIMRVAARRWRFWQCRQHVPQCGQDGA
jgi:hypothetical protein